MKYNKREIMKKAWEVKRKLKVTLKIALRISWKLAKKALSLKEEDDMMKYGKVEFNVWQNYGYTRAYYKCNWYSNYQNNYKKNHFIDISDCIY